MFTRFAASCTNMDPLDAFGPTAEKQFIRKSKKYNIDIDDVRQNAHLIYVTKNHLYDKATGTRAAFLWAHLDKLLLRESLGPLKCAFWLDDNSEMARWLREQLEALAVEDIVHYDISESEITTSAILEKCRKFALSMSGKSPQELAILWGKSVRRVNQIIAEWCTIANAERLRTKE